MWQSNKHMTNQEEKNYVVIYSGDDWSEEIPISYELTRKAFERWHAEALKQDVEMYRASIEWYDDTRNVFAKSWAFRDGQWRKIESPVRPDFVYDKTPGVKDHELFDKKSAISKSTRMFNSPLLLEIVDNSGLRNYHGLLLKRR